MTPQDAWQILDRERETKLDSACVDALARVLARRSTQPAPISVTPRSTELAAAS